MKRSVAIISVAITTFSAVWLASVIYGLRAAAQPASSPVAQVVVLPRLEVSPELQSAAEVASPRISPQAAVTIASEFLKRTDAYSVQLADYSGQQAYKVVFASGDVVYVSLSGQVLGSVPAGVQMASANTHRRDAEGRGGGGNGENHEETEEPEEVEHEDGE